MADKPRILHDSKDLIWSLIPLLLIALVVAGISGSCSFGFGNSATDHTIPSFDAKAGLQADADTMPFSIREPDLPKDWKSNSGTTQEVGSSVSSNVGWITPDGVYVQLTQTGATEDALVYKLLSDKATGEGVVDIDGQKWVKYAGEGDKRAWIADFGDVRIAVVSRDEPSMTVMAKAVGQAQPLPHKSRP
ncbi:DUF4245 domain-containing protein [Gordonia phthalatica]|uniref:DUF4245 domain-containing protein n=1 Tax=Gordonia phthalatica TaxID=1136941 RepID=A0A0N9N9N9_9ACTN|nr:DUF4245 domain-containing protein [Gordonia phthalatica]ALG84147.1 hypothetical protein ACH46_06050 [Gordonia phthalatica]